MLYAHTHTLPAGPMCIAFQRLLASRVMLVVGRRLRDVLM